MHGNGRVFISHSHDDNDRCKPLLEALSQWGVDYWFDTQRIEAGQSIDERIQRAIDERDVFIRICSGTMQRRPFWVNLETSAFRALQAQAVNTGYRDKRVLINIIMDNEYQLEPFDRSSVYIDAARLPSAEWQESLGRALGLSEHSHEFTADSHVKLVERPIRIRRLPVYFLIDTSTDMAGAPIAELEQGIALMHQRLLSDPQSVEITWISIIAFGNSAHLYPLVPAAQFAPPQLVVSGGRVLGQALHLLNQSLDHDIIAATAESKGDYKPLVTVILAGSPSDKWHEEAEIVRTRNTYKPLTMGLAAGSDNAIQVLDVFCTTVLSMRDVSAENLTSMFKLVSPEISAVSDPRLPTVHKNQG